MKLSEISKIDNPESLIGLRFEMKVTVNAILIPHLDAIGLILENIYPTNFGKVEENVYEIVSYNDKILRFPHYYCIMNINTKEIYSVKDDLMARIWKYQDIAQQELL